MLVAHAEEYLLFGVGVPCTRICGLFAAKRGMW